MALLIAGEGGVPCENSLAVFGADFDMILVRKNGVEMVAPLVVSAALFFDLRACAGKPHSVPLFGWDAAHRRPDGSGLAVAVGFS